MKQKITITVSALLMLSACDKESEVTSVEQTKKLPSSSPTREREAFKPAPVPKVVDAVPPMTEEAVGTFSPQGLADAFKHATTLPLSSDVKPLTGTYRVWSENDFANRKRSSYIALFRIDPKSSLGLADQIEAAWKKKYSGDSDIKFSRSIWKEYSKERGMDFTPGTVMVGVYNPYASYTEVSFKVIIDSSSGNMLLRSYRGTNDSPNERDKEKQR